MKPLAQFDSLRSQFSSSHISQTQTAFDKIPTTQEVSPASACKPAVFREKKMFANGNTGTKPRTHSKDKAKVKDKTEARQAKTKHTYFDHKDQYEG